MNLIPCNNCGSEKFAKVLEKESGKKELFQIVKCTSCGLVQVNPQPSMEEVAKYYSDEYFTRRSDRGYDNYYSSSQQSEIERVFKLNLADLDFFNWESSLPQNKRTIDIGCAAGYFVAFMNGKGWKAEGIEIAKGPVEFGRNTLGVSIHEADFLSWDTDVKNKYELITLWASIEHLHKPKETLQKIFTHLKPGGRMILSSCRYGVLAKLKGINWRYLNVPEHLYFYSLSGLIDQSEKIGFKKIKHITYGSGMTARKNAGKTFKLSKKIMDWAIKKIDQGDMMAIHFEKEIK
jgi:2-polyprenyl-3-methyl-5-hydroxy-6-metoxy-1,4-benzoquinol methylase